MNKVKSAILAFSLVVACVPSFSAATSWVSGGKWTYGVAGGRVYSQFYHPGTRHQSSVINYKGDYHRSRVGAGKVSNASLPSGPGTDSAYYGFY